MADLADRLNKARGNVGAKAEKFLPDLCSLSWVEDDAEPVPDGFGGTTPPAPTVISGIRCKREPMKTPMQRIIAGGEVATLDDKITMPSNEDTQAIKSHYKIIMAEGNGHGELVFEQPSRIDGSFSPFVEVAAVLSE